MNEIDWDDAYANGAHIEDAQSYPPKWAGLAAEFRTNHSAQSRLDVAYGTNPREVLDLFTPTVASKGLVVFVHGGYWKAFDKSSWSHLAHGALRRGFSVVLPSYPLCPDARVAGITKSIAHAIEKAAHLVSGPVHLSGHSAGGHLVTRMLCGDVGMAKDVRQRLARVVSVSGVHDLRPLLNTAMKKELCLSAEEAGSESPLLQQPVCEIPVTAWVGAMERPVFIDQSRWLSENWPLADLAIAPQKHHFDVIDDLALPESALIQALLG